MLTAVAGIVGRRKMAVDDYDVEFGYSLNEMAGSHSRKAYSVSEYELRSLEEIDRCIVDHRYIDRSECIEHEKYLEELQKRLTMILLAEEREGIMNWELREFLKRVRSLAAETGAAAERLPEVAVYRENAPIGVHSHHQVISTHSEPFMS